MRGIFLRTDRLCWAVLAVLTENCDTFVSLSEIQAEKIVIQSYPLGNVWIVNPRDEKSMRVAIRNAISYLRRKGYNIASLKPKGEEISYCWAG